MLAPSCARAAGLSSSAHVPRQWADARRAAARLAAARRRGGRRGVGRRRISSLALARRARACGSITSFAAAALHYRGGVSSMTQGISRRFMSELGWRPSVYRRQVWLTHARSSGLSPSPSWSTTFALTDAVNGPAVPGFHILLRSSAMASRGSMCRARPREPSASRLARWPGRSSSAGARRPRAPGCGAATGRSAHGERDRRRPPFRSCSRLGARLGDAPRILGDNPARLYDVSDVKRVILYGLIPFGSRVLRTANIPSPPLAAGRTAADQRYNE